MRAAPVEVQQRCPLHGVVDGAAHSPGGVVQARPRMVQQQRMGDERVPAGAPLRFRSEPLGQYGTRCSQRPPEIGLRVGRLQDAEQRLELGLGASGRLPAWPAWLASGRRTSSCWCMSTVPSNPRCATRGVPGASQALPRRMGFSGGGGTGSSLPPSPPADGWSSRATSLRAGKSDRAVLARSYRAVHVGQVTRHSASGCGALAFGENTVRSLRHGGQHLGTRRPISSRVA